MAAFAHLIVLLIHLAIIVARGRRFLALFRPKSKHTSLFVPVDSWTLPLDELRHCYGFDVFDAHFSLDRFDDPALRETFYVLESSDGAADDGRLAAAAARCVLLHGLYELWADADSPAHAAKQCATAPGYLRLRGTNMRMAAAAAVAGRPWLSQEELHAAVLAPFKPLLVQPTDAATECPPAAVSVFIYVDGGSGRCVAGRLLARGPAAPMAAGQVGQTLCSTLSRPISSSRARRPHGRWPGSPPPNPTSIILQFPLPPTPHPPPPPPPPPPFKHALPHLS